MIEQELTDKITCPQQMPYTVVCIYCRRGTSIGERIYTHYSDEGRYTQAKDGILMERDTIPKDDVSVLPGVCFKCVEPLQTFGVVFGESNTLLYIGTNTLKTIDLLLGEAT